jgi:tRNA dimethylallyltransferase
MIKNGLIEEAKAVFPYRNLNALNTVGYKELFDYFDGKYSLEICIEKIKTQTRRYAKRQMTWLRKNNKYVYFEPAQGDAILRFITNRDKENFPFEAGLKRVRE